MLKDVFVYLSIFFSGVSVGITIMTLITNMLITNIHEYCNFKKQYKELKDLNKQLNEDLSRRFNDGERG